MSFFTLKLQEEAKKIAKIFQKFQRWMKKMNIFKCKPPETECHIINNLLTELARAIPGNIGPRSFSYGVSAARFVLSRGPYCHKVHTVTHTRLESGYYFLFSSSIMASKQASYCRAALTTSAINYHTYHILSH